MIARWGRRTFAFFEGLSTVATTIAGVLALTLTIWGGSQIIPGPSMSDSRPPCSDQLDNDKDGEIDFAGGDTGCSSGADMSERDAPCSDGHDNDEDGKTDFPTDPSCVSRDDLTEKDVACSDRRDNDHDGKVDFDHDDGCTSVNDTAEKH